MQIRALLLLPFLSVWSWPRSSFGADEAQARDDNRAAARALAIEGRAAFEGGDYSRAVAHFRRAQALFSAPTLTLFEARALALSGRLLEASEAYQRTLLASIAPGSPEQFRRAAHDAEAERAQLVPRIPKLVITVAGTASADPRLVVALDREPLSRAEFGLEKPVDPGKHEIAVSGVSRVEVTRELSVREGETQSIELKIDVPTSIPPSSELPSVAARDRQDHTRSVSNVDRILAYTAFGLGGTGLAVGVVAGSLATSRRSSAARQCPEGVCIEGTEGADALDSFRTLRTASTVGYVVGFAGITAGVTFLILSKNGSEHSGRTIRPWIGTSSAGIAGAF